MVLAMAMHARTQDDFFPGGRAHVGSVTLPTALAMADEVGDRLLDCLLVGYRSMCLAARPYAGEAQRRGYRPTGFFGPFGAAATAAAASQSTGEELTNCLGLAAVMTAGTNQAWLAGSDEWLVEVGMAARSGIDAIALSRAGARAADDALEGDAGWAHAFFHDAGAVRLDASLGLLLSLATEMAVKPYPISGIAQVPAYLACAAHREIDGATPIRVVVRMSVAEADYPGSRNRGPFAGRGQALMSVAHCVAVGLADGRIDLARLEDPTGLSALTDRVEVVADSSLEDMQVAMTITAPDGRENTSTASGRDLLFPSWHQVDPSDVAHRSEAEPGLVLAAHTELSRDRPDARVLRDLLIGAL